MNIYYVYFYLRENFTPYYVGKGKGYRAFDDHGKLGIPDKSRILFVHKNLSELQAFMLERYYIRWFGRKDLDTGILYNRTDGGQGCSGIIFSRERIAKLSNKAKERVRSGTHNFLTPENGKSIQTIRKENNKHPAQYSTNVFKTNNPMARRKDGSTLASDRSKNGTHNFLSNKDTVPCIDKDGKFLRIPKQIYHSQSGSMENWEWVFNRSKEGSERIKISNQFSCD